MAKIHNTPNAVNQNPGVTGIDKTRVQHAGMQDPQLGKLDEGPSPFKRGDEVFNINANAVEEQSAVRQEVGSRFEQFITSERGSEKAKNTGAKVTKEHGERARVELPQARERAQEKVQERREVREEKKIETRQRKEETIQLKQEEKKVENTVEENKVQVKEEVKEKIKEEVVKEEVVKEKVQEKVQERIQELKSEVVKNPVVAEKKAGKAQEEVIADKAENPEKAPPQEKITVELVKTKIAAEKATPAAVQDLRKAASQVEAHNAQAANELRRAADNIEQKQFKNQVEKHKNIQEQQTEQTSESKVQFHVQKEQTQKMQDLAERMANQT